MTRQLYVPARLTLRRTAFGTTVTSASSQLSALTMPTPERASPRRPRPDADAEYFYRRPLRALELLPAIGSAVVAGLFAFYVTRLLLQRTPLNVERRPRVRGAERAANR